MAAESRWAQALRLRWLYPLATAWIGMTLCSVALGDDSRPIRVLLHWRNETGDADCLDEAQLAQGVEVRLQRQAFVQDSYDLQIDGGVVRERGKRVARIVLRKADGEMVGKRELESPDSTCSTLNEAVPLSVALMIDYQQRVLRLHVPVIPPPPLLSTPDTKRPATLPVSAVSTWQLGTRVGVGIDIGALPGATWLALVGMELTRGWSMLRVDGLFFTPKTASLDPGDVFVTGWSLGASACGVWKHSAGFHSAYCLGGEAGRLYLAGSRFLRNTDTEATHGWAWGGTEAQMRLADNWWAGLGGQLGTPIVMQRWEYTNEEGQPTSLFASSRAVGRLLLTIGYSGRGIDQKVAR